MREVLLQQLAAAEAQLELLRVMVLGIRRTLDAPRAEQPALLPTCAGETDEHCARLNGEACTTFATGQRMCRGCGLDPVTGEAAQK